MLRTTAAGLLLGAGWGVFARVWMRLISTEPEFSWTGTLAIIGFSALLGLGVGLVHGARRTGRSGWWTVAIIPGLILFLSPGLVLAPCFALGGLAWGARGRWLSAVGVLAVAGSVGLMTWAVVRDPLTVGLGDVAVFETGYVVMALTLARAGSLVWQRRTTRARAEAGHPAAGAARTVRSSAG
jgi:hypothetical protein